MMSSHAKLGPRYNALIPRNVCEYYGDKLDVYMLVINPNEDFED